MMWEQQGVPEQFPAVQYKRASRATLGTETPYSRRNQQYSSYHSADLPGSVHDEHMSDECTSTEATTQLIRRARPVQVTEDDIDIAYADKHTKQPNSARRYHNTHTNLPAPVQAQEVPRGFTLSFHRFVIACIGVLLSAMLISALWVIAIAPAMTNWSDTATYGYPRIYRTEANVGHGSASRFFGINNGGVIEVVELSKDAPTGTAKVYVVTTLIGPHSDLVPISSISFVDVHHNHKPEMLVIVGNEEYQFDNTGSGFTERQ